MSKYIDILNSFDVDSLPDLDVVVLGALDLLDGQDQPTISLDKYQQALVVGSGNAEATGRIIYGNTPAIFASESTVDERLASIPGIDGVVIISASGGKHAPIIAGKALAAGKKVTLITNTENSPTAQQFGTDEVAVQVFAKNREPYTYNTSTYMSMIQGYAKEDIAMIRRFIDETIDRLELPDFARYDKYYLIVPPQFSGIIRMLQVKFIELFGRNVARDVETSEYVRHATTVAPSDELFISFGEPNNTWGEPENRLFVPLPETAGYVSMMAVSYYMVGQIQKAKTPYFKQNIVEYTKGISEIFGENIQPIVE